LFAKLTKTKARSTVHFPNKPTQKKWEIKKNCKSYSLKIWTKKEQQSFHVLQKIKKIMEATEHATTL
jgi:hypothetical protein